MARTIGVPRKQPKRDPKPRKVAPSTKDAVVHIQRAGLAPAIDGPPMHGYAYTCHCAQPARLYLNGPRCDTHRTRATP